MTPIESEILATARRLGELQQDELLRYARALLEAGAGDDWSAAAESLKDLYVANGPLDLWGELSDAEASAPQARAG